MIGVILNSYGVLLYINMLKSIARPLTLNINVVSKFLFWKMNINVNVSPVYQLLFISIATPDPSDHALSYVTAVQHVTQHELGSECLSLAPGSASYKYGLQEVIESYIESIWNIDWHVRNFQ